MKRSILTRRPLVPWRLSFCLFAAVVCVCRFYSPAQLRGTLPRRRCLRARYWSLSSYNCKTLPHWCV